MHDPNSLRHLLKRASPEQIQAAINSLDPKAAEALKYDWTLFARDKQLPPAGTWWCWLLLAGRGFGKTRTGAEWVKEQAESGEVGRIALIAPTASDVRDVMVEGSSGILAISRPDFRPDYEPSKRRLTWPNGCIATTYSADEPERLNGPQHHAAWCDEIGVWRYAQAAWDMLMFGLRLGEQPRCVVTTTPKASALVRSLVKRAGEDDASGIAVTRGSTFENKANLADGFFKEVIGRYEGTRLGRQELYAEILEEAEGALWSRELLDVNRRDDGKTPPMKRVVVAVDPAMSSGDESDETGIVVAGLGEDNHGYVLADRSGRYTPDGVAREAIKAFDRWQADRIVGEVNNGGEWIGHTIRVTAKAMQQNGERSSGEIAYRSLHASRGKHARAEPVAALDEQGRVHHVGAFQEMEDQLCTWEPLGNQRSPDRLDARVWALTELMLKGSAPVLAAPGGDKQANWAKL